MATKQTRARPATQDPNGGRAEVAGGDVRHTRPGLDTSDAHLSALFSGKRNAGGKTTGTRPREIGLAAMTPSSSLFPWKMHEESVLPQTLFDHVADAAFPCVGAKAALARGSLEVLVARDLCSAWDDVRIHDRLIHFAEESRRDEGLFNSLAVVFEGPDTLSEDAFEQHLWQRVQSLSDKDLWRGQNYDGAVSSDPGDPHFSLSFGGEAFFVVGLHPKAGRPARRFPHPVMVFNPHAQFETLRAQGKYEGMREKIMVRDEALAGSRNPMLAQHGTTSEARQYSGRHVDQDWKCPFRYKGA